MSILVNKDTRLICQGITGRVWRVSYPNSVKEYGTNVVAGVTPGKGGQSTLDDVPVFDTVSTKRSAQFGADATMIFVPPAFTADAILRGGRRRRIKTVIIAITEGVPVDGHGPGLRRRAAGTVMRYSSGPTVPGVITPEECKIGIMPGYIHQEGPHRRDEPFSGTLTYEAVWQLSSLGLGQSHLCRTRRRSRSWARRFIDAVGDCSRRTTTPKRS